MFKLLVEQGKEMNEASESGHTPLPFRSIRREGVTGGKVSSRERDR